jgi:ParB family transcriptional regulator, chromosome partitioning protein
MRTIIAVNPFRCRVWHLHPRLDELITEESCEEEIRSFEAHRQLVPALGRYIVNGSDHDIEIICGARRLFVARHLKESLLVEMRDMTDKEAIIALELENGQRLDISPYERGMSYARWLREGYFSSQGEIALALRKSASQVSRLLKLASLPAEVIEAFGDVGAICEGWGVSLANATEDPERALALIEATAADGICSGRASSAYRASGASSKALPPGGTAWLRSGVNLQRRPWHRCRPVGPCKT